MNNHDNDHDNDNDFDQKVADFFAPKDIGNRDDNIVRHLFGRLLSVFGLGRKNRAYAHVYANHSDYLRKSSAADKGETFVDMWDLDQYPEFKEDKRDQ